MLSEPRVQLYEGEFRRVRVRKQDVILITTPKVLEEKDKGDTIRCVQSIFPGNRVLLLDDGMAVQVMAPMTVTEEQEADEEDGEDE